MFSKKKLLDDSSIYYDCQRNGKYSNGIKTTGTTVVADPKLRIVLLATVVLLILYKICALSMSYTSTERLIDISDYLQQRLENVWEYVLEPDNQSRFVPILCGIALSLFSWILVYLDSNIPGIHPPSPFSPRSKEKYRRQKVSSMHIGFITALASGVVTTGLMLYNF